MMVDLPIIFSGPMVRALLDGRKTMTRRIIKPQPAPFETQEGLCAVTLETLPRQRPRIALGRVITKQRVRWAPGDRLYVRETWGHTGTGVWTIGSALSALDGKTIYAASDAAPCRGCWWPSIHMPRAFSRLTLVVTAVKIERLQDISEADATAEGMQEPSLMALGGDLAQAAWSERQVFSRLWNHLHGDEAWGANPFVVAITFTVHHCNIDSLSVAA